MDNNQSERRLRNLVIGRKNYYGSGSLWSGNLAAMMFTLFQTLLMHKINPQKYLTAYFEQCALHGGNVPDDKESFLPWNLTTEQKNQWLLTPQPPCPPWNKNHISILRQTLFLSTNRSYPRPNRVRSILQPCWTVSSRLWKSALVVARWST